MNNTPRDAALHWFQEGFHAGVLAGREQERNATQRRSGRAIEAALHEVIGVLAVALLEDSHRRSSEAASRREEEKRQHGPAPLA